MQTNEEKMICRFCKCYIYESYHIHLEKCSLAKESLTKGKFEPEGGIEFENNYPKWCEYLDKKFTEDIENEKSKQEDILEEQIKIQSFYLKDLTKENTKKEDDENINDYFLYEDIEE